MSGRRVNISSAILRAIKVFGGVQMASNICSIALNKLVALWIGPVGFGLFSLYNSAIDMLRSATSLGIRTSSVRDIAIASESGDSHRLGRIVSVVRRWGWFIGLFGAITTMALAPALSQWSFGNSRHIWDFIILASALLFSGITHCELAILQGVEKMRQLANASLSGAVGGLALSIPLFYFLRTDSILLSVIVYHVALLASVLLFRYRNPHPARLSNQEAAKEGGAFVKLGIFMTVSEFVTMLFNYIFVAYLNHRAGTEIVGFYQAGYSLVGRYVSLVFTALSMEYYPRLARICHSRKRLRVFVSQEINMLMLTLVPLISIFLSARELIVWLLYSDEFHTIIPYISIALAGTLFKAYSWAMALVIVAKGDGKIYILTESASTVTGFLLNIAAYNLWGLDGLGFSYAVWYACYSLIIGAVYLRRYHLSVARAANIGTIAACVFIALLIMMLFAGWDITVYIVSSIATVGCILTIRRMTRR